LSYSEEEGEVFLGRSVTQHKTVAEETSHTIDEEIRSFIDRNYERARNNSERKYGYSSCHGGRVDEV